FDDSNWSEGAGAYLSANGVGDFVTYSVPIPQPGSYNIKLRIQTGPKKGIFQLAIGGIDQGSTQDEYSPNVAYEYRDLGTATFTTAGKKQFTSKVTGRNPSSNGYTISYDY